MKKYFTYSHWDLFQTILLMVGAYCVSSMLLRATGWENNSSMIYVMAVMLVARLTEGYLWGFVASVVSTFCLNYFFMPPYGKFDVGVAGYPVALFSMLVVAFVTGTMTSTVKRQAEEAKRRERHTRELYQKNRKLEEETNRIQLEKERETMRGNLLRAVSHDLRTPLTTISGATDVLLSDSGRMNENEKKQMLKDIQTESLWLISMVENLLSVTKIQPDAPALNRQPDILEDVVTAAILRVKRSFPEETIQWEPCEEILMPYMDSTLIEQVVINLLENAVRHSGSKEPIEVVTYRKDGIDYVEVRDRGKGLAAAASDAATGGDSTKGLGIGLSVCRSIIQAHEGSFTGEDREGGGAVFRFGLPENLTTRNAEEEEPQKETRFAEEGRNRI